MNLFQYGFNDSLGCAGSYKITACPLTKNQIECSDKNGFSGTGFTGDNGLSRSELNRELLNQCVIFDIKAEKHGLVSWCALSVKNITLIYISNMLT